MLILDHPVARVLNHRAAPAAQKAAEKLREPTEH